MHIAALVVRLEITDGLTLKDKRHVVRSLLDRIRGRFNVSAAEVGENDSVRYAQLAAVAVSNERVHLDRVMAKVGDLIEGEPRAVVISRDIEFL
jgi:uncharacterized protein YlxP (DUF503 family)